MGPVGEGEPFSPRELDRLGLPEGRLIASNLLIVHELGDDHIVALDVGDSVLLGKAPRLKPEVGVLPGDARCGVGTLEGDAAVGRAALSVRDGDLESVDRIEAQVVELLRRDGDGERLTLRGVVDRADFPIVELLLDGEGVPVRVVDRVLVGEGEVLVAQVAIDAGDRRGRVRPGECPCPGRRSALPIRDDDLDRVLAEAQFVDWNRYTIFQFSRRGERLRRSPINRLRRRQDVAGVGVVDRVLDCKIAVLIT